MKQYRPPKARKEPSSMERGQAKYEGIRKQREMPQEYVDYCKTHNHEQVPEECSDGSISIPSKQVEEQGKRYWRYFRWRRKTTRWIFCAR